MRSTSNNSGMRKLYSPQAIAFRDKHRNEFELYKRSQQMRREYDKMRIRHASITQKNNDWQRSVSSNSSSNSYDANGPSPNKKAATTWRSDLPNITDPFGLLPPQPKTKMSMQGMNTAALGSPIRRNTRMTVSPYLSPAAAIVRRNSRMPQTVGVNKRKSFAMKVIKEHKFDSEQAKRTQEFDCKKKEQEKEARLVACHILMDHGVSAAQANKVARRASMITKKAYAQVSNAKEMVDKYQKELLEYRKRLAIMEQAEMARQAGEITSKEELMANNGKKLGYFVVPNLSSSNRKHRQSPEQEVKQEEELKARQISRATQRCSKYIISDISEHHRQKDTIKARMIELASLLAQEDQVKKDIDEMFWMDSKLPSPLRRQSIRKPQPTRLNIDAEGMLSIPKSEPADKKKSVGMWNF